MKSFRSVAVFCALAPLAFAATLAAKPNILVFYLDDMGWAQPGCYGGKLAPTPAMDAIAKNGVRFTDGYVSACVCGPSRVGLMTGRYQAKGRIPPGRVSAEPVIQLDVLPTALAAANVAIDPAWQLDGVNLLPLLEGKVDRLASRELYFRFGVQYAVRQGDWKLVKASKEMEPMLVNLGTDRGEKIDLAAREPERARVMQALFDRWSGTMQPPRWEDRRWDGDEDRKVEKREIKKQKKNKAKQ